MSKTSHLLSKQNSQQPKQFRGGEKKVMKKSLSLLVAIAMVFSMFATVVSAAEKTAGQKLEDLGIIKGTSDGLAEKEDWKRQDVTVLIARLLGKEDVAKATANTHGFTDVDSKFYNGFISWAKAEGYFTGETATKFGVGNSITNQQFAAVLLRVLGVEVDYAAAFEKAVELKLVSADLVKTDNAVRGDIYESLLTALDYKIDGKKLGTILGLKGYEVTDLEVLSAKGTNQKTVKVEFNNDLGAVTANNFSVKRADNDSVQVIQNVTVSGVVATITLVDALTVDKDYVVTATNVSDKEATSVLSSGTAEFKYVKAVPASIGFEATTVEQNAEVKVVIKDAEGNDISANYTYADIDAVASSSVVNIVNGKITAAAVGVDGAHTVVSAKLKNTELTTGNVIIYVKQSLNTASSIGKVTLGTTTDPELSIFKGTPGTLVAEIVDAKNVSTILNSVTHKANFRSLNPTVLVVDATTGIVQPVANGSATVVITGTIGDKTVSKSVVVTVKDDAKIASVSAEKSVVNLVKGSNLQGEVKLNVKDQYGNNIRTAGTLEITSSTSGVVAVGTSVPYNAEGVATLPLLAPAANADKGTTVLTFKVTGTNLTTAVTVNVVDKGTFVGYAVELSNTTLDANTNTTDANKKNPTTATVKVYEKDSNGNNIAAITTGVVIEKDSSDAITTNATDAVTGVKAGSSVITVKVNNVVIGTYTITVLDTKPTNINKVAQNVNAITVDKNANISEKLFGNAAGNGGAFTATNQFGAVTPITGAVVYSANGSIVNGTTLTAGTTAGTTLLTVVIAGQVFTINVVVQ
ncbi:MAG: S-layer homology domain-containing protein [Candidatus Pristimantibacillus lignocellulolyticus]|uniref:S-layer homology domain-containing protein n=1 Tax=Candidatus Pristimantibacillus lignocellulolyticus TaxID=2994561 RepID=A0A9J6ZJ64_9BACL|nr:MAG: S-layer homology domain-containing protein [Candidatus Pristimantibacillus lignocellulolyticus]